MGPICQTGPWIDAQSTTALGVDGYKRDWRHPFPKEACDKLGRAIHESNGGSQTSKMSEIAWSQQRTPSDVQPPLGSE
jgi:hypothetical protein